MTLSNFEWTDKESVKWFIMLPSGHEGPYSLSSLQQRWVNKTLSAEMKIWAEGLSESVSLRQAIQKSELKIETKEAFVPKIPTVENDEDLIPPLPYAVLTPEEPVEEAPPELTEPTKKLSTLPARGMFAFLFLLCVFFGVNQWLNNNEKVSIRRHAKMSVELHEKIVRDLRFEGWNKGIFFKEFVSADLSTIWLINSGFQTCEVEASFHSIKGKLLSMGEEEVIFSSKAKLLSHVAEFNQFAFQSGQKVIPGLYDVKLKAHHCEWDSLAAKVGNKFSLPEESYTSQVKLVLFPKGAQEFNSILELLIQKKSMMELQKESKEERFRQDVQEKLQTLLAISKQIEQFFLDLLTKDARKFSLNLKEGIDQYTKQFGHTLTNFVISNEKDFQKISPSDLQRITQGTDYEKVVRLMSKEIGFESMKLIEHFQSLKAPRRVRLNEEKKSVEKIYSTLSTKITQKIEQFEDQQAPQP